MAFSSSSKLLKRGEGGKTNKDDDDDDEVLVAPKDKISELPDAILCHILSFFPTRYAVRTSVLSKRWRYVWTLVPCIEIAYFDLLSSYVKLKDSYPDVVDSVLHLNKLNSLRKFKLCCNKPYDSSRVHDWISDAIMRRGLEKLLLDVRQPVELPTSIFTSKNLVILKLIMRCGEIGITRLNVPVSVCLPCLKSIHVDRVQLCNDDSLKNLLNGCPVLEELNFTCEYDDRVTTLFVKSSSLKRLILDLTDIPRDNTDLGIVIEAPNLELLDIAGAVTEKIVVIDLSSIVEVTLGLRHHGPGSSIGADVFGNRLFQLLGKMSNTEYMTLSLETMKLQSLGQARLDILPPTFHNLIDLSVHDIYKSSWHVLPFLLECSPNLINFHYCSDGNLQFLKPQCAMLHLEKFDLAANKKGCTDHEMRMVKYFLNNAPVLNQISIWSGSEDDSKMLKGLSMLPSRSTACRIIFTSMRTSITINL